MADALGLGRLPGPEEHTELFLLQLPPYASVYLGPEGMLGGEARGRVSGFWRAVGRTPPAECDHIGFLLGLHASLLEEEAEISAGGPAAESDPRPASDDSKGRLARHARHAHFHEHLACWLFPYLLKVEEIAAPFYRGWSELLRETLEEEAGLLGSGERLPVHLDEAPEWDEGTVAAAPAAEDAAAPEGEGASRGSHDLVAGLLTPVRSGLILTRSDLLRASRTRGLPLRIGERRFALRAMLAAEQEESLAWLSEEAEGWAERHREWEVSGGRTARFWQERARATAELLRGLRSS